MALSTTATTTTATRIKQNVDPAKLFELRSRVKCVGVLHVRCLRVPTQYPAFTYILQSNDYRLYDGTAPPPLKLAH
jgi:hypothetical protein